jgi:hypothetical protein
MAKGLTKGLMVCKYAFVRVPGQEPLPVRDLERERREAEEAREAKDGDGGEGVGREEEQVSVEGQVDLEEKEDKGMEEVAGEAVEEDGVEAVL